jgi:hypothetical protein
MDCRACTEIGCTAHAFWTMNASRILEGKKRAERAVEPRNGWWLVRLGAGGGEFGCRQFGWRRVADRLLALNGRGAFWRVVMSAWSRSALG